ncbi:MAG: T9SS type A sorting domain-containing protein [Bacteroidia bacterium]|nr:T9SS type A sorting domain-containing protein [Bacteroidia bacterium]
MDVADLPCGVYFLQVETKDKRRGVRKFIKQ